MGVKDATTDDFNSHAHVERDLRLHCYIPQRQNFNSHAHVERDLCIVSLQAVILHFNSHAHVERDRLHF